MGVGRVKKEWKARKVKKEKRKKKKHGRWSLPSFSLGCLIYKPIGF